MSSAFLENDEDSGRCQCWVGLLMAHGLVRHSLMQLPAATRRRRHRHALHPVGLVLGVISRPSRCANLVWQTQVQARQHLLSPHRYLDRRIDHSIAEPQILRASLQKSLMHSRMVRTSPRCSRITIQWFPKALSLFAAAQMVQRPRMSLKPRHIRP